MEGTPASESSSTTVDALEMALVSDAAIQKQLEESVKKILTTLRLTDAEYEETPRRVADLLKLCTRGRDIDPGKFLDRPLPFQHDEMVAVKNIEFFSVCPHHLWPYFGSVDIAYIPNGKIAGLSKFHSVVECIASMPRLQEEITRMVADVMEKKLSPRGTMVVVEAKHTCMFARGRYDYTTMSRVSESTVTSALRGVFLTSEAPRMEALKLFGR